MEGLATANVVCYAAGMSAESPKRPNILLILADDMGYADLGCYGSEIATPHLDRLAANGVRFSQMYNCARCCPSRASLLTGLYPHQAGIGHMVNDRGFPEYQGYLNDQCVTLAEALAPAGYFTGMTGKWHVGGWFGRDAAFDLSAVLDDGKHPLPHQRGFERSFITPTGGNYFNIRPLFEDGELREPQPGFYSTDTFTDHALSMIDEATAAQRPFFLHVAYQAPHWPLHAWEEDIARFDDGRYRQGWDALRAARHEELKGLGILDATWPISARDESAPPFAEVAHHDWEARRMATYAAQIHCMDRNIGRLVDRLEERGELDHTLIIFLSDNGGCAEELGEGHQRLELPATLEGRPVRCGNLPELAPGDATTFQSYGLPWANASNSPFRLFKHWVHEGGISTPGIFHWPGHTAANTIQHATAHFIDIMPTLLDVAGAPAPRTHDGHDLTPLPGESLVRALEGHAWQRSTPLFWEHEGHSALRDGDWKLVRRHGHDWELFRMDRNRTETDDQAPRERDRVAALADQYADWALACGVRAWPLTTG